MVVVIVVAVSMGRFSLLLEGLVSCLMLDDNDTLSIGIALLCVLRGCMRSAAGVTAAPTVVAVLAVVAAAIVSSPFEAMAA